MDESTASLDADNEAKINQALDRLMKGKTVFVIAHRLNTIQNADQIIVLNQGRIEETGTHDDCLVLGSPLCVYLGCGWPCQRHVLWKWSCGCSPVTVYRGASAHFHYLQGIWTVFEQGGGTYRPDYGIAALP